MYYYQSPERQIHYYGLSFYPEHVAKENDSSGVEKLEGLKTANYFENNDKIIQFFMQGNNNKWRKQIISNIHFDSSL